MLHLKPCLRAPRHLPGCACMAPGNRSWAQKHALIRACGYFTKPLFPSFSSDVAASQDFLEQGHDHTVETSRTTRKVWVCWSTCSPKFHSFSAFSKPQMARSAKLCVTGP